jgi:hypothetical protein
VDPAIDYRRGESHVRNSQGAHPRRPGCAGFYIQQRITGVVVNDHCNVPRTGFDTLKATLHNCVHRGPHCLGGASQSAACSETARFVRTD